MQAASRAFAGAPKTVAELEKKFPAYKPLTRRGGAAAGIPAERLRWLPVRHRKGFWTALIDIETGKPVRYVASIRTAQASG